MKLTQVMNRQMPEPQSGIGDNPLSPGRPFGLSRTGCLLYEGTMYDNRRREMIGSFLVKGRRKRCEHPDHSVIEVPSACESRAGQLEKLGVELQEIDVIDKVHRRLDQREKKKYTPLTYGHMSCFAN